jgi:queuine tRNA-ribosyltransferase
LIKSKEILGLQIASIHNLGFYLDIVLKARQHIIEGDFMQWKNEMCLKWQQRL